MTAPALPVGATEQAPTRPMGGVIGLFAQVAKRKEGLAGLLILAFFSVLALLFFSMQRLFVSGLTAGATKG